MIGEPVRQQHDDAYRFAYDEASSELRNILIAFEQLCAQKHRIEKLLEVLKPQIDLPEQNEKSKNVRRTTHLPSCTVVTRLIVR
jgi:hypothetical protein